MRGQGLAQPELVFYMAELVLTLEHLHAKGIIYRDLKVRSQ
eukprot:SAG22_NODE_1308_length_4787_cov_3.561860_2_plen_41_part_00